MVQHHPDDNILAEYSAGALTWALSLGVAAHLHFCPECRNRVASMNQIGAALLSSCQPQAMDAGALDQLMQRIKRADDQDLQAMHQPVEPRLHKDKMLSDLPLVLTKLLPKNQPLRWKFVSPSLKMTRLQTGQSQYEVALNRIRAGGKVAEHDHRGLEVNVVLKGSFSDGDGVYTPGDFLVRQSGEIHRPTAAQNEDCLCFTITDAPAQVTGLLGKLINPFLSFKPG